jgi:hypothetical protein
MKRYRRTRRLPRRGGVQHISELLAILMDGVDRDTTAGASTQPVDGSRLPKTAAPLPPSSGAASAQSTFTFYEPSAV